MEKVKTPRRRPIGRPRRAWGKALQEIMKVLVIKEELALDQAMWKRIIAYPVLSKVEDGL